ncbi:hypothetical protein BT63DRAFT_469090 [Microthyrium microscopicum]|uniref:Uncharacterized protein n=1 Tax=Microthyrium microscopicum TaxID=703497 RepID=A0A6A6UHM9_9PEZI|nr:hypothetical protein BT63DRAFT_469090 [Microthyrium microscopicum]
MLSSSILRAFLFASGATAFCTAGPATANEQEVIFNQFIDQLYGKLDAAGAFNTYVSEKLVDASPDVTKKADGNVDIGGIIGRLSFIFGAANVQEVKSARTFKDGVGTSVATGANKDPSASQPLPKGGKINIVDKYTFDGKCITKHEDERICKLYDAAGKETGFCPKPAGPHRRIKV